ncbi:MAG: microcin C transport system permease protein [Alphaproteobacteria bacterium]|jgi:microcin C transport system permease protein
MIAYIVRRLGLIVPTLFGIMVLNFAIVQFAPGGPVEQLVAQLTGTAEDATARVSGAAREVGTATNQGLRQGGDSTYRGARGLDPQLIADLKRQYGFDKPAHERFFQMIANYAQLDFGTSFFRDTKVIDLVIEKMPVSISLGLWSTLIIYLICIPLGIAKAVRDGSRFDFWTSFAIIIGYAIPGFMFAVLLIVLFAGGSYFDWFPLRGLTSENWADLSWPARIVDYFWHLALPLTALIIGGFATLTMLTKNMFLEELSKQYVITARAKGLSEKRVRYGHVFRNAMLIPIANMPEQLIDILFTGALLIEIIFSLDGLGLLSYESVINRDYPVVFATLFIFSLLGLVFNLIRDVVYVMVDPRISFERSS